ncbi:MAG: Type II/IV secretion system protein TadC, associated with Flp pilus assembly [uncultured Friedmanniella sp.]|uniref:Type II/IV secretion system protein TadC, associated with Flp pilus assembly n=1 Tax=uncultured Friedmanniella sp. TaxID=335381 RepID=A0A6J4KKG5_9ACTN|nr:type II secretion system F family protein [uncultured Friedmanniella sp.]CAA9308710.1 MAG: Type II/IV secretion system protein TadC, associated with Flp pilus assembly [uncultured Friedmanniella sp.]
MPPLAPLAATAVVLLAAAVALLTWTVLTRPHVDKAALANLRRGLRLAGAEPESERGGASRLGWLATRLTPPGRRRTLERLWTRAGRPAAWPVPRLVLAKLVLPLVALVLSLLYLSAKPGTLTVVVGAVVTVVCHFLPELLLHSRAQERSQKITLELADTLDQMTIAVEAGLGFDGAMAKAGQNGQGPLAEELVRTLQDIQLGQSRREAYESLAGRTDVVDLRRFVRAVVQADKYGVAVADVLRTQAAEMRMKRRQRAEEKAMQIPVKVIFPLMLCILPVLFIVLLGPAAMDIVGAFS